MSIYGIENIPSYDEYQTPPVPGKTWDTKHKGSGKFTFGDILDIVNPFHHIPVVSTAYRFLTDDKILPFSKIIGGIIYGRVFGFIASIVDVVVETVTGKDIGDHILTTVTGSQIKKYAEAEKMIESINNQSDTNEAILSIDTLI